jgi:hypothetical protein
MNLIEILDTSYYTLYYCSDIFWRVQNKAGLVPIPPPHEYFSSYIHDTGVINGALKEFMEDNISSTGRDNIKRLWGLTEPYISRGPFSGNPLLQLHFARFSESIYLSIHCGLSYKSINELLQNCSESSHTDSLTMKGRDPYIPNSIRSWNDSNRIWPCYIYSFATPSPEAIARLVSLSPLVEIGAGTGYWSHLIRQGGGEIVAYDRDPPTCTENVKGNSYHGRAQQWTTVQKGGPEKLSLHTNTSSNLLLCYPPPDNDMSIASLRAFRGRTVCYVGEWQGDTGTKAFEKQLSIDFKCVEIIPLPNWSDTCYMLSIWERRDRKENLNSCSNNSHVVHPFQCRFCGMGQRHMYRCRLSYNICFCNEECASNAKDIHLDELSMRYLVREQRLSSDSNTSFLAISSNDTCYDSKEIKSEIICSTTSNSIDKKKRKKKKRSINSNSDNIGISDTTLNLSEEKYFVSDDTLMLESCSKRTKIESSSVEQGLSIGNTNPSVSAIPIIPIGVMYYKKVYCPEIEN